MGRGIFVTERDKELFRARFEMACEMIGRTRGEWTENGGPHQKAMDTYEAEYYSYEPWTRMVDEVMRYCKRSPFEPTKADKAAFMYALLNHFKCEARKGMD